MITEALQRAVLWPSFQPTPPQMLIPPISITPTVAPHLLLDTNVPSVDFMPPPETLSRTPPQHRILITAENAAKRKIIGSPLIKVETTGDNSNSGPGTLSIMYTFKNRD
mgnify:CR=1 FL=1